MKTKALFFLVIFLLNTLVGFACTLHLEYASPKKKANGHTHDHSAHTHHDSASQEDANHHDSHNHHSPKNKTAHTSTGHTHSQAGSAEDDSCCQDEVSKFYSLDKIAPHSEKIIAKAPVLDIIIFCYNPLATLHIVKGSIKYIDNRQRPPTRDIRIAIQSFQI